MIRAARLFFVGLCLLSLAVTTIAQSSATAQSNDPKKPNKEAAANNKAASDANAERARRERRAQAQSLLIALAADAGNYSDDTLRARTQARIADALWETDQERGRTLFRKAWDAAEVADKAAQQRVQEEIQQQQGKNGNAAVIGAPNVRGEVLRLAARHDRALGEELLDKLKTERQQEATEAADRKRGDPYQTPEALAQRLSLARQLLDTDVNRALDFADAALHVLTKDGLNFLSYLRDKDPVAADKYYAALLATAAGSLQSDANTVSLLSSYLFTPHLFVTFEGSGGTNTTQMAGLIPPPNVSPELRAAFFNVGAQILLRPQPPPEQDQSTSRLEGRYLMIKRLLPLFEQFAPGETTEALRTQMEALGTGLPNDLRNRDDDSIRQGIRPPQNNADAEQVLHDRIDRAKTSAEQDRLYVQLIRMVADRGEMRARDLVEKIQDSDLREKVHVFVDGTLIMRALDKKDNDRVLELVRLGEISHLQKSWALTQVGKVLLKTDREKAVSLLDEAAAEARRIDASDPDRPRALMAVANTLLPADRARGWEATTEAVKAANSSEAFTGEDGLIRIGLTTASGSSVRSSSISDFNVADLFTALTKEDYGRAIEAARGFEREGPRASAVIAIAHAILSEKPETRP
jgi:hypothetical protein